jgi:uncharacterized membrane protein
MKALTNFMSVLFLPLAILNPISGIVSIIWLIILGDWSALIVGVGILVCSSFAIGILMLPGAPIIILALAKVNGRGIAFYGLSFLGNLYSAAVMSAWCLAVFILYGMLAQKGHHNILPYLLGSYVLALEPWQGMAAREQEENGAGFMVFFAQVAYVVIMLMALLATSLTIGDIIFTFCAIMFIAVIIQFCISITLLQETEL